MVSPPAPNGPARQLNGASEPQAEDTVGLSHVSLSFTGGSVTLWSDAGMTPVEREEATQVALQEGRPVVVGRQQGGEVPYLDPSYVPTQVVPVTGQSVLTRAGTGPDLTVSRGHFLLRADREGVVLLNGVPRRGGGVRPPLNGTWLLQPEHRRLDDAEEYLIRSGHAATIRLPNGTQVLIRAA
jgi:hypothetical protein